MDSDFSDANGCPQLLLTIDQVAELLGICRAKLYVHLAAGADVLP